MLVKLTQDVAEGGRSLKMAVAAAAALGIPSNHHMYPRIKRTMRGGKETVYKEGTIVEVSEGTAAKWIAQKLAEPCARPAEWDKRPANESAVPTAATAAEAGSSGNMTTAGSSGNMTTGPRRK